MTQREDIFRLPPLTMAEAKVLNTIVQLNLPEGLVESPEILRKIRVLSSQVMVAMEYGGKTVIEATATDPQPVLGRVRDIVTHEEYKEHDWEDVDRFDQYDEERRGTMLLKVEWREPDHESPVGYYRSYDWHRQEDLKVVPDLDPDGPKMVLDFSKSKGILGPDSEPVVVSFEPHPSNGWLFKVRDSKLGMGPIELIQLTDNEAAEMGGLTTRHLGRADD